MTPKSWQALSRRLAKLSNQLHTRPDSPCIAICSTAQGDPVCQGCGRTFEEVTNWVVMTQAEKDLVWERIESERTALRYTTYKERAL
ncbi:MAG: hypothetical protein RLZZ166_769 [Pseudomonadota bacterium]